MKNIKPQLSVVILTYNSNRTIEKCLKSLENQSNKNFEVLIVDDDSTDNTLEIIKDNEKSYSFKIKYLRNGKHNISMGRNIGIKNAKTRYVAFIDSDAYADKDWVKNILKSFKDDKELGVVSGGEIQIFTNNFSRGVSINDKVINKITSNFWKMRGGNLSMDVYKLKNIYFNEKFLHNDESEFIYRIEKNFKSKYNPKIIIHHESRNTPLKYFKQMYKYSIWRVFFSFYSKKFRIFDFYPSILIMLSIILMFNNLLIGLFLIPVFSLTQSIFVIIYNKSSLNFLPNSFLGWLIKNLGWGFGIIIGLIKQLFGEIPVKITNGKI